MTKQQVLLLVKVINGCSFVVRDYRTGLVLKRINRKENELPTAQEVVEAQDILQTLLKEMK